MQVNRHPLGGIMKAWEVVAIVREGEYVCEDCLKDDDEKTVWNDADNASQLMEDKGIGVVFASDDIMGDEVCGRCGEKLI